MSVKEILLTVLSAALMNNLVFTQFLGISSVCAAGRERHLGAAVTAVMLASAAIGAPVASALAKAGLSAYNTFVFAIIILALCSLFELLPGKKLKLSFPLVALNSSIMGLLLLNAGAEQPFIVSLLSALGAGLGFWLALVLMNSLELRLSNPQIPRAFRGYPVRLLTAAIISMAICAF